MATKIQLNVDIWSDAYNDDTMELLRTEMRKNFLRYVYECAENVEVLGGPIDRTKLNVDGGITITAE